MDISEATDAILNFAEKASHGTTLTYQLHSYQNHLDYQRTVACCDAQAEPVRKQDRYSKKLITELIGLQTLERWITTNSFGLDSKTKFAELENTLKAYDKIMALVDQNKKMTYRDLKPILGLSEKMQRAYLDKYEPTKPVSTFPIYSVNSGFVASWKCVYLKYSDTYA